MTTNYQQAKSMVRAHAEYVSVQYRGDKPMIRQSINDYADHVSRDFDLTNHQRDLLANYVCTLHTKD